MSYYVPFTMSIIAKNENDAIVAVCSFTWMSKMFDSSCGKDIAQTSEVRQKESLYSESFLHAIFQINNPFIMNAEANNLSNLVEESEDITNESYHCLLDEYFSHKKKRRKLQNTLELQEYENLQLLSAKFQRFQETDEFKNLFIASPAPKDLRMNNFLSRKAAVAYIYSTSIPYIFINGHNKRSESVLHYFNDHKFVVPAKCHYLNAEVFDLAFLLSPEKFDIVVVDPPWPNKHVWRMKKFKGTPHSYETLSVEEIMRIPLSQVLNTDAFVFIWTTNSHAINEHVKQLLHMWDLEFLTTWFWLKITQTGYPVISFETAGTRGKLPYEKLLVTRRRGGARYGKNFPDHLKHFIICSVPSSIHSHKPPLKELLNLLLNVSEDDKCLEIFARSLTPGWTSIGNQVLLFQDTQLLQTIETPIIT